MTFRYIRYVIDSEKASVRYIQGMMHKCIAAGAVF